MLLARSKTVVDVVDQAATIGELHHAIVSGLVSKDDVHAQLGEIVAVRRAGRNASDQIIVFDSSRMALQDVIVAAAVYQKASIEGLGQARDLCARNNANGEQSSGRHERTMRFSSTIDFGGESRP